MKKELAKKSGSMVRTTENAVRQRSGAAHVLIALMLFGFAMTVAFSIDFAYMQLIRTELRTATDAAAKAGAEALMRTKNTSAAIDAAVQYASLNKVAGRSFQISRSDVLLGQATVGSDGLWRFNDGQLPYNSVRVNSRVGGTGVFGSVPLFFQKLTGGNGFKTSSRATAAQQSVEIVLCIDRSASMSYNMVGIDYRFSAGNPLLYANSYYPTALWRNICSPPHPTQSRWAVLRSAIDQFLTEAGKLTNPPRTAVVTWSSDYKLEYYPFSTYTTTSTDVSLPSASSFNWTANSNSIQMALTNLGNKPLAGATRLSDGLDRAVQVLTGTGSQVQSNKVVILITDGMWGECRDPQLAAQDAAALGVTVHCVSMLTGTQDILTKVANLTGGRYYPTADSTGLQTAFRELAQTIPIVLTE
ncbi:MAG: VWA domain-containing protein [Planctomycetia bacterium]